MVRLVADWIERGVLRLGPAGFVLRPGEAITVPDGLHEVWKGVIGGLVAGLPPRALRALWCAAVLGTAVSTDDWTAIIGDPAICAELVERMQAWRLAEPTPTGWRFAHGMLRESLLRDAEEAGRLPRIHAACARRLEKRASEPGIAERLGTHLLAAGQIEAALGPLMHGVYEREETMGVRSALALYAVHERAMESLNLPPSDPRFADVWLRRADLYRGQGEFLQARQLLERVREGWTKYGWKPNPTVLFFLCSTRHGFGDVGPSYEALFDEWKPLVEASGDPIAIGKYWYQHSNGRPAAQR
ncbi:MAG TPA: hypothetical protein VFF36_08875, partial [Planctomycetota bacterium]|nr:hypothetical protein [Planctomycetota bacterium]